jgi:hypothetical protein
MGGNPYDQSIGRCVCKRGFFGVDGCLACAAGAFKNTTGSTACAPCPVGTVSLHDLIYGTVACTPCAEVLNSPFAITRREGGSTADACVCNASLGYRDRDFVPGETPGCAPCSPGTIWRYEDPEEYSEPSSVCVDCLQGQHTDLAGLVACKTCLMHASSYEHPRVSCQRDAGYTFDNFTARTRPPEDRVSGICRACEERTFKNEHGDHECSACPAHSGSPSASIAVTSCQCDPGFFGADGGMSVRRRLHRTGRNRVYGM